MRIEKFTNLYRDVTKEGTKIPQEKYCLTGQFPIVDQGQRVIAGWWNDDAGIFKNVPAIIFGDHTRAIKYMEQPFFIGADGVKILRPTNIKDNPKYLYYALQAAKIPNLGYSRHFKVVKELEIRIYSRDEQNEIVRVLEKIDYLIEQRHAETTYLDQLVKSRFIELFGDPVLNQHGWRKVALEVNATLLNGRAYKQDELLDSGKYPVLRVGNFFSNRGWYYSDLELDDDKYCDNGDLLYAWSASFGPQIWNGGKVIYHYHIWKVLVGEAYNKQFLCKLLEYATESLMGDTHGIAMMPLTKSGMEKTEFIVPPIEQQEQFAAFVEQTDKSKYYSSLSFRYCQAAENAYRQEWITCRTSDF